MSATAAMAIHRAIRADACVLPVFSDTIVLIVCFLRYFFIVEMRGDSLEKVAKHRPMRTPQVHI
jgi:hypothetical protein